MIRSRTHVPDAALGQSGKREADFIERCASSGRRLERDDAGRPVRCCDVQVFTPCERYEYFYDPGQAYPYGERCAERGRIEEVVSCWVLSRPPGFSRGAARPFLGQPTLTVPKGWKPWDLPKAKCPKGQFVCGRDRQGAPVCCPIPQPKAPVVARRRRPAIFSRARRRPVLLFPF